MFIDFEGIDGSGKTTLSNLVASRLKKLGHKVAHARESGQLQSAAARRIRELTRDSALLELAPRTEFFLNVARDAQQLAEVIKPALDRGEICISDRYLYSQLALSGGGRGLPLDELRPAVELASQGIWPDLVILVDVDPDLARLRKRLGKLGQAKSPDSRKGLVGAGLAVRVRETFLDLARKEAARWIVIENDDQPLWVLEQRIVDAVLARIERREMEVQPLLPRKAPPPKATVETLEAKFERALDELEAREPALAAYLLSGIPGAPMHRRRLALVERFPALIARGLSGLRDEPSWGLRELLAQEAPAEVLASLGSDPSPRAMALRARLFEAAPAEAVNGLKANDSDEAWALRARAWAAGEQDAVLGGLAGVGTDRAWKLREAGEADGRVLAVTRSLGGLEDPRAEAARERLYPKDRLAVLRSTTGLDTPFARKIRTELCDRATKVVMRSLTGVDVPYAWELRVRAARHTKEALDSVDGMDGPEAWALRGTHAGRWPATVLSSLRPLPFDDRARELFEKVLAGPTRLPVLRNAYAAWAVGTNPEHRERLTVRAPAALAEQEQVA